jgi:hypothetical protein
VRKGPGLNHVLHGELPCDPGKVPDRSRGLEKRRGSELDGGGPAAAAEARAPANGCLSLINTWLREVLWFTGKGWSSWMRLEIGWSTVLTGRRQWRTAAARQGRVRARERTGRSFYRPRASQATSPKHHAYRNRDMGAKAVDDVRRGSGQWRMAVRPCACARQPRVTGLEVGARHAHRRTMHGEARHGPTVTGLLRRACPAVRRRGMPMARRRALGCEGAKQFNLPLFQMNFLPISKWK